jgi:hypothetical protein
MDNSDDYLEDIAGSNNTGDGKIGGIPSKFLDLSHFPHLQKSFPGAEGGGDADHHQQHRCGISGNVFSPEVAEEGAMWDIGKKRQHCPIKKLCRGLRRKPRYPLSESSLCWTVSFPCQEKIDKGMMIFPES